MRMPNRILKGLCAALLSAGLLLLLAVVVWWFKRGEGVSFQDIVFWVGALPIVFFYPGLPGAFFRAWRYGLSAQPHGQQCHAGPENGGADR